jgi:hypothetical protein
LKEYGLPDVSAVQQLLQDDCFIVFGVPGAVEQGGGASGDGLFQDGKLGGAVLQFGFISRFELGPFDRIVSEPLPEIVARGDLFDP